MPIMEGSESPKISPRPVQSPDGTRIRRPMTNSVMLRPVQRRRVVGSGWDTGLIAQLGGEVVAVEEIVGVEGDDLALRRYEVDAGALDRGDAEVETVEELHDDNAED